MIKAVHHSQPCGVSVMITLILMWNPEGKSNQPWYSLEVWSYPWHPTWSSQAVCHIYGTPHGPPRLYVISVTPHMVLPDCIISVTPHMVLPDYVTSVTPTWSSQAVCHICDTPHGPPRLYVVSVTPHIVPPGCMSYLWHPTRSSQAVCHICDTPHGTPTLYHVRLNW